MTQLLDRSAGTTPETRPTPRRRGRRLAWIAGVVVVATIALTWALRSPDRTPRATIARDGQSYSMTISPDGGTMASGGLGLSLASIDGAFGAIRERRVLGSGDLMKEGPPPRGVCGLDMGPPQLWPVVFSPDGKTVAASNLGTNTFYPIGSLELRVWDVASGRLKATLPLPKTGLNNSVVHPQFGFAEGGRVFQAIVHLSDSRRAIRRWDTRTWQPLPGPTLVLKPLREADLSDLGDLLPRPPGEADAEVVIDGHEVWPLGFTPDGSAMALTIDQGSILRLVDAATGRPKATLVQPGGLVLATEFSQLTFSPNGRAVANIARDQRIQLWDVPSARLVGELAPSRTADWGLAWRRLEFSPDGRTVAVVCGDYALLLYDLASAKVTATLPGLVGGNAPVIAFSPDGRTLAVAKAQPYAEGPMDRLRRKAAPFLTRIGLAGLLAPPSSRLPMPGRISFLDVATGRVIGSFTGTQNDVGHLAYLPDGQTLATSGMLHHLYGKTVAQDHVTMLWDVPPADESARSGRTHGTFFPYSSKVIGDVYDGSDGSHDGTSDRETSP